MSVWGYGEKVIRMNKRQDKTREPCEACYSLISSHISLLQLMYSQSPLHYFLSRVTAETQRSREKAKRAT